jgi:uncharacterized RDD family membrane protein YckC
MTSAPSSTGTSAGTAGFFPPPPPPPQLGFALRQASLGTRAVAALLDLVVLAIIAFVIALPLGVLTAFALFTGGGLNPWFSLLWGPVTLTTLAVFVVYFTVLESGSGQTLGKRVLDLRVVSLTTGRPPDLGRSLVRNVLRIVDWLPFFYLLGFLIAALSSRHQRLGDLAADTLVVQA